MRHDEIDELLGAFALDAVDDDERREIEAYLEVSPRARAEVQAHREVATMLAFGGSSAPEGLWDRIAGALEAAPPAPGPELAKVLPITSRRRRWSTAGTALAAAAAAVVATVVVAEVVRDDRGRTEQSAPSAIAQAFGEAWSDPAARKARLVADGVEGSADVVIEPDGIGFVSASQLPELPEERTYQLWGVVEDRVISLGVLGNRPDIEPFTVDDQPTVLVITQEVAGGVVSDGNPDGAFAGELA